MNTETKNWYDNIPEQGVVCSVCNYSIDTAKREIHNRDCWLLIEGVGTVRGETVFIASSTVWKYATPVTR
jgi:hypothetical protein